MAHLTDPFDVDRRSGAVVGRGLSWGLAGGAVSGAVSVLPLVVWNGPAAALLVYPALAAVPGALVGAVLGVLTAWGLVAVPPVTRAGARSQAAFTCALCVGWLVVVAPRPGVWVLALTVTSGALLGPRVSARPTGVAAAAGTTSPGSSPAPGR